MILGLKIFQKILGVTNSKPKLNHESKLYSNAHLLVVLVWNKWLSTNSCLIYSKRMYELRSKYNYVRTYIQGGVLRDILMR